MRTSHWPSITDMPIPSSTHTEHLCTMGWCQRHSLPQGILGIVDMQGMVGITNTVFSAPEPDSVSQDSLAVLGFCTLK